MSLAYKAGVSLAADTEVLRTSAKEYSSIASDIREMAKNLDKLLAYLRDTGWKTPAGEAFQELVRTDWSKNMEKYASLLETFSQTLTEAATEYERLASENIKNTKLTNL